MRATVVGAGRANSEARHHNMTVAASQETGYHKLGITTWVSQVGYHKLGITIVAASHSYCLSYSSGRIKLYEVYP